MYFEDLSKRGSIIVRQRIKMAGFAVRKEADKCSLCFSGFACKLAASLVNGIKINVHSFIVVALVFELRVNIEFVD